jgi:hypothetical protein
VGEPALRFLQGRRIEAARYGAAAFVTPYQAGDFKHVEMLEHCRQRHGKRLGQLGDGEFWLVAQAGQHRAAGWIGQGGKDAVKVMRLIVNHQVKLRGKIPGVNSVGSHGVFLEPDVSDAVDGVVGS